MQDYFILCLVENINWYLDYLFYHLYFSDEISHFIDMMEYLIRDNLFWDE